MWYQVGCPWMLDGKMFLPWTGMPILKKERSRVRLAVWLPVPLAVATIREKSLTTASTALRGCWRTSVSVSPMRYSTSRYGRPRRVVSERRVRSEEHTSELQSRPHLVCRLLLEKKEE